MGSTTYVNAVSSENNSQPVPPVTSGLTTDTTAFIANAEATVKDLVTKQVKLTAAIESAKKGELTFLVPTTAADFLATN